MYRRTSHRRRAYRGRGAAPGVALLPALLLVALAACDFPTELPKWNTTWLLPGEDTTIGVASLLPAGVSVAPGGEAFQLGLTPIAFARTLGEMCPGCAAFDGLLFPKPAFTAEFGSSIALPPGVVSASLAGGQIRVVLRHDFSFDPLRPSPSARGHLVVTARAGATTLAKDSIAGETTALPPNADLVRTLALATADVAGPIAIEIRLHSPGGDPVVIDTRQGLTVTVTPLQVRVARAQVVVSNRSVSTSPVDLDLEDVDDEVTDRLHAVAIRFTIENPFDVSGSLQVRITRPGLAPLVRPIEVQPGSTSSRVEFTGDEVRTLVGRSGVTYQLLGDVSSPAGGTAVTPADAIGIRTRVELTLGPIGN